MTAAELYIDLHDRGLRFRVDDETDRLIVSPGNRLTDADRSAIRQHKLELMAMASIDAVADPDPEDGVSPARLTGPVPSRCLGPTACAVLGVCGREACVTADEFGPFGVAMAAARRPTNPHLVPDFSPTAAETLGEVA